MNTTMLSAVLLVLVPLAGSVLCALVKGDRVTRSVVGATVLSISLISVYLFYHMVTSGLTVITMNGQDLGPAGPIITVLGIGLLLYFGYIGLRTKSYIVLGLATIDLLVLLLIENAISWGEADPVMVIDYLTITMVLITSLVGATICIYALRYMGSDARRSRFFAVMLLFLASMMGAVLANDLLWLFLFWDATTLCSFLLIGHTGTDEAKKAAGRALMITLGGGTAFIVGALLALHFYGTISIAAFPLSGTAGIALLPFSLLVIAGLTKSAQLPFQSWLLGAMVAPTPVSALLHSATMVNLGVYLMLRLSPQIAAAPSISWTIALVGGLSFLVSSVLAIAQNNAKKILAYSTIANLGLITMCVGIGTPLAIIAAMVLLLYHAISKALMFLAVGVVKVEIGTEDIDEMTGLRYRMPFVSLAIFIGIMTIVLPPFGMFASKWLISEAVVSFPFLAFLLAAGFAAIVVYYFKWLGNILSAPEPSTTVGKRISPIYEWTLGSLIVGAVVLSLLIGLVVRYLLEPFVDRFFASPVTGNALSLLDSAGQFPVFFLLVLVGAAFLGLLFLIGPEPRGSPDAGPYAGGETFTFEPSNSYYISAANVDLITMVAVICAIVLLLFLIIIPILLGAV